MNKIDIYQVATLFPLLNENHMKKQDVMDIAQSNYLNQNHQDFNKTISDGKSAGRKNEEWAI